MRVFLGYDVGDLRILGLSLLSFTYSLFLFLDLRGVVLFSFSDQSIRMCADFVTGRCLAGGQQLAVAMSNFKVDHTPSTFSLDTMIFDEPYDSLKEKVSTKIRLFRFR